MSAEHKPTTKQTKSTRRKTPKPQPARVEPSLDSGLAALSGVIEQPERASAGDITKLQKTAGNRAVQRLLARREVQAKLTVGAANDAYEAEADRVAETVMRAAEPTPPNAGEQEARREEDDDIRRLPLPGPISSLQRKPEEEEELQRKPEEEEELQRKPEEEEELQRKPEEEEELQAKESADRDSRAAFEAGPSVEQQLAANKGRGAPLPHHTRSFMENQFGSDFGRVRIHTGNESSQLNRQLSAQAFTHGADIYFDQGKYNPGTHSGMQLLAHELTHVVQQTGGVQRRVEGEPISRGDPHSVQRLISSAQLKAMAGEPHTDKKILGFTVKKMSSAYKAVLAALDRYQSKIAGIPVYSTTGSTDPFNQTKADAVLELLNALEAECKDYIENHADDTKRTPYIQGIIDDIPAERTAIQTILNNPSNYPYTLREAIQKARMGSIVATATNMMSVAANRQLNEVDQERVKEANEANEKARLEGKPETAVATPVPRTSEELMEEGLASYESDMDRILAGDGKSPGRAPVAQDWRGNTQTTKIGSALGLKAGEAYFRTVLAPALSEVLSIPDALAEVDPARLDDPGKVPDNAARMRNAYASLMRIFNEAGAANVPLLFAQFCSRLHALALRKGMDPKEAYLLVSSQIFLRTINPMIINMVSAVPQGHTGKRAMMIVSKLFQDDANNVKHGLKEPFMAVFTDSYQEQIASFVRGVIARGGED